jgi:hypothetical protein
VNEIGGRFVKGNRIEYSNIGSQKFPDDRRTFYKRFSLSCRSSGHDPVHWMFKEIYSIIFRLTIFSVFLSLEFGYNNQRQKLIGTLENGGNRLGPGTDPGLQGATRFLLKKGMHGCLTISRTSFPWFLKR